MIKFINKLKGTEMWVADERKDEYLRAGHKLALDCAKPTKEEPKEPEKKATVKKTPKKK